MEAAELRKHMLATYRSLRLGVAAVGLALPWALWLRGLSVGTPLRASMSDYYYVPGARDLFLGGYFAAAALLFVYRGYSRRENGALNLAALSLAAVALVPTGTAETGHSRLHVAFALLFFAAIVYVCLACAGDTLVLIVEEARRKRYRRVYLGLGIAMVLSPLAALLLSFLIEATSGARSFIFFVEAAGVYAFSAYWLVKTREIRETDAEALAMLGKLRSSGEARLLATAPLVRVDEQ